MLFKILHGDDSRISTDITPFHEGYCYVTHSGYMYVDINIGTIESPNNQRIKLNAANAETLTGLSLDEIKESIVIDSARVTHGEDFLSDILETYIFNIDYNALLAFDTSEIVIGATSTTSVLGQAILGQMVLA